MRIAEAGRNAGLSADTLRYYERIGLLPAVARDAGGRRRYGEADLARLRFIRRAQATGFSLDEIRGLLRFRENPGAACDSVRAMAAGKLEEVVQRLDTLTRLHAELERLVERCRAEQGAACPILEGIEDGAVARRA